MKRVTSTSDFFYQRSRSTAVAQRWHESNTAKTQVAVVSHRPLPISIRTQLAFFFSLLGCSYQIYLIASKYFLYLSVSELTIQRPLELQPPALTFCVDYPRLMDRSKLGPWPKLQSPN